MSGNTITALTMVSDETLTATYTLLGDRF